MARVLRFPTKSVAAQPLVQERDVEGLLAEAELLEARDGPNPYSRFLRKHHSRPGPQEADAIGRAMGGSVRASDGKLRPHRKQTSKSRRDRLAPYREMLGVKAAIDDLAKNTVNPADLLAQIDVEAFSGSIGSQLDYAIAWLLRFAEEWRAVEQKASAGGTRQTESHSGGPQGEAGSVFEVG